VVERWGSDGVATLRQLQGGYGLVIVDRWRNQLWLVRDPIGIKTLYLTRAGALRWIAPCLRSLAPYRSNALDTIALRDYLCCAFVPGERTLWSEVRELRPGTLHLLPQDRSEAFFDLKEQIIGADKPLEWHGGRLQHGLIKVVAEALRKGKQAAYSCRGDWIRVASQRSLANCTVNRCIPFQFTLVPSYRMSSSLHNKWRVIAARSIMSWRFRCEISGKGCPKPWRLWMTRSATR
jgi:hypothetical protein